MKKHFAILFNGLNWWNKFILSLNLLVVLILVFSYLSPYINPSKYIAFAYLGLVYPIWLFSNLVFILYWLILLKWHFFISVFAIVLGILPLSRFIQVTFFQPQLEVAKSLKIMSYNVRVFDLYNWSSNIETKNKIVSFLEKEKPDVICFQEYFRAENIHFSVKDTLMTLLDMKYVSEYITDTTYEKKGPGRNYFGSAIFSKYPIINYGNYSFANDKNNLYSFIDIVKNNDTIRIFNAHLGSMRLQNADYKLIGGDDNKKWQFEKQAKEDLLDRMNTAFKRRSVQSKIICNEVKSSPYPVVLCTDLNDTPNSFAYNILASEMIDAFVKTGNGIGSTYIGDNVFNRILPVNRIDYIFYSKQFESAHFTTHSEQLSDHRAISCELQLK